MTSRTIALALLVAGSAACVGPRTPQARVPYSVRLLGAADGALRGASRDGRIVFTGSPGRDYAIEVTNDTPSNVGVSILIDGIDAKNGTPATSCEGLGGWIVVADSTGTIRGFAVAANRIATYRFAPRERSLAAMAVGGRRESIGTIEVCIFTLRPSTTTSGGPTGFEGVVRSDASPAQDVVAELRDDPTGQAIGLADDKLISRIFVTYVDEEGRLLGTAPPPAGVAHTAPVQPPPVADDREPPDDLGAPPKGVMPPKGVVKPPKPSKPPKLRYPGGKGEK